MENVPIWRNNSLKNLPGEIWKPITGFEGFYEVSNYSRIKGVKRIDCKGQRRSESIKLLNLDSDGYLLVVLSKDRKNFTLKPHRLCAIEFISNPENKCCVNHIDGVKTNCHISNLEWNTEYENREHAIKNGLRKDKGQDNAASKLTNDQVIEIYNSKLSNKQLAIIYNVVPLTINRIKIGYKWSHITGHKYKQKYPSYKWKKSTQS